MNKILAMKIVSRGAYLLSLVLVMGLTSSCAALLPASAPPLATYALEAKPIAPTTYTQALPSKVAKPTLIINTPHAAAGYQTRHMLYTRLPHQLEHYAHSEWLAPPAQMLAPLMMQAITSSAAFSAVVMAPSNVVGDYRLETEMLRLQQDFVHQPSTVQLTVRVTLIHHSTRKVAAVQVFDEVVTANSEDAYGGVVAANQAVQTFLTKLTAFGQAQALSLQH